MSDDSDQKLNIANYFISSSPTGEVDDVVTGMYTINHPLSIVASFQEIQIQFCWPYHHL